MTVRDYITLKLKPVRLTLTDADWSDLAKAVDLDGVDTDVNIRKACVALATKVLPFYVNQASSVTENGFSATYNEKGLTVFYKWLCRFTGMDDTLSAGSTIEDTSYMY
jgi:hypothetical protein